MPLYKYQCEQCGKAFEKLVSLSAAGQAQVCPQCGSDQCHRQFASFSSNVRKGSFSARTGSDCGSCGSSRFT